MIYTQGTKSIGMDIAGRCDGSTVVHVITPWKRWLFAGLNRSFIVRTSVKGRMAWWSSCVQAVWLEACDFYQKKPGIKAWQSYDSFARLFCVIRSTFHPLLNACVDRNLQVWCKFAHIEVMWCLRLFRCSRRMLRSAWPHDWSASQTTQPVETSPSSPMKCLL